MLHLITTNTTFKEETHSYNSMIEALNCYNQTNKEKAWTIMLNDLQVSIRDLERFAIIERSRLNYILFNDRANVAIELPIRASSDYRVVKDYIITNFPTLKLGGLNGWDFKSNSEQMKLVFNIVELP